MLKAIIFDLDDTLIDWSGCTTDPQTLYNLHFGNVFDHVHTFIHPLSDKGLFLEMLWDYTYTAWENGRKTFQAPTLTDALMDTFVQLGVPSDKLDASELLDIYRGEPAPGVEVFPDVHQVLPQLRQFGIKLGLITNAYHPMQLRKRELEAYGLIEYFEPNCLFSAADVGYIKPHPFIFNAALQALNVKANEAVFIGDSLEADILGAQNIGMRGIFRNNGRSGYLAQLPITPDAEIGSLHDLFGLLDEWFPDWRD